MKQSFFCVFVFSETYYYLIISLTNSEIAHLGPYGALQKHLSLSLNFLYFSLFLVISRARSGAHQEAVKLFFLKDIF